MLKSEYASLVREIAKRLDFNDAAPNEENLCVLSFDEMYLSIRFIESSDMISLYVNIADVPEGKKAQLCERLLDAQCFFRETAGATFSICPELNTVLLHLNLYAVAVNVETFYNAVQHLLHTAEKFRLEIEQLAQEPAHSEPVSGLEMHHLIPV
ncbi:MAG: type III secretion system chaperone [Desulfovibrionaceae bacterium]|nr:type III secretion system chaperone [Desulfovibrionaceae bacterium]